MRVSRSFFNLISRVECIKNGSTVTSRDTCFTLRNLATIISSGGSHSLSILSTPPDANTNTTPMNSTTYENSINGSNITTETEVYTNIQLHTVRIDLKFQLQHLTSGSSHASGFGNRCISFCVAKQVISSQS